MFDNTKFTGMLIKGELREAVKYLKDFPEKKSFMTGICGYLKMKITRSQRKTAF